MNPYWTEIKTPAGVVRIFADDRAVTAIDLGGELPRPHGKPQYNGIVRAAEKQLREYFAGCRTEFDLPLALAGTEFQRKVWAALRRIPFGQVRRYGDIAKTLHKPAAARAVGAACGKNPLPIVVPCHRVVGSSGSLTGFAGGLHLKEWLLRHEGIELV